MCETLEQAIGDKLLQKGWQLALAESCTSGLVGHRITHVPGASRYFRGGIMAYSNDAKQSLLGVSDETLEKEGAVSQASALAMARGARQALQAEVGLAVTGIAGPSGGTPAKPVGLTWIAVSTPRGDHARAYLWQGDRAENIRDSAQAALHFLLEVIQE